MKYTLSDKILKAVGLLDEDYLPTDCEFTPAGVMGLFSLVVLFILSGMFGC